MYDNLFTKSMLLVKRLSYWKAFFAKSFFAFRFACLQSNIDPNKHERFAFDFIKKIKREFNKLLTEGDNYEPTLKRRTFL